MSVRVLDVSLVLCLLLRRVFSVYLAEDLHLVDGLINQHVTLPCSFIVPDNWSDNEIHVTWFRNFTEKLLDCSVREGATPVCHKYSPSSRVHLSWKFLGNADLDIYRLQESDGGHYQCWIIFNEAYQRRDSELRVHSDPATTREVSPLQAFLGWQKMLTVSIWNVLLVSGWPFAFFLVGMLLSQRCHNHRKGKFTLMEPSRAL